MTAPGKPERNKNAFVFFLKYPRKGKVKTRLAADIGDNHALNLYQCFVRDMLAKLAILENRCDIYIFLSNADDIPAMKQWPGSGFHWPLLPQEGEDLGKRMSHAFETIFQKGYAACLLTGSDFPDLPGHIFPEALTQLSEGNAQAVIGPTADGGYYLLGFQRNRFCPAVLDSRFIAWSTEAVFQQTMDIFHREGIPVETLPQWWDVDNTGDLRLLMERGASHESHTMRYLEAHRDELF